MEAPIKCQDCGHWFHEKDMDEHRNLHVHPSELAPRTKHHGMARMEYTGANHYEPSSETTDIALRSLLPQEIPQDQREKARVGLYDNEDDGFGRNGDGNDGYGDPNDPNNRGRNQGGSRYKNYRNRDKLDLNSNLANASLTNRDELNKLNIEKNVELKQVRTQVPRKEIKKYQNDPYSSKQIRDLGGCDKKVQKQQNQPYGGSGYRIGSGNDPRDGDGRDPNNRDGYDRDGYDKDGYDRNGYDRNGFDRNGNEDPNKRGYYGGAGDGKDRNGDKNRDGQNEEGYRVMRDNNASRGPAKKEAIFVPINRRTNDPNQYGLVDTKLNGDNTRRGRRGYGEDEPSEGEDLKKNRQQDYPPYAESRVESYNDPERDRERERRERQQREREQREKDRRYDGGREEGRQFPNRGEEGERGYPRGGYYIVKEYPRDQKRDYHDHGLHPHECPDCHGFYCRTCGATIPPQYRPFWDEDESPEMIEFYKKRIRNERERERKQRGDCRNCMHPGSKISERDRGSEKGK